MKKFEEEVKGKAATMATQPGCSMTRKVWYKADDIHELSEGWVSPEDHQAEIEKLKSQLAKQQPEIPEVSKEVANIYEKHKDQHHKLSVILEELYVNTFATFGSSLTQGEVDDIVVAMRTNGYTVKEKRFYLKDKLTGLYLYENDEGFSECERGSISWALYKTEFTQQEVDSMETGSYDQIEVEE